MCEVRSKKNSQEQKKQRKKKYSGQQQKEINYDEPHPAPNEKTQPIQWTERPTGALVVVNSLWLIFCAMYRLTGDKEKKFDVALHWVTPSVEWVS
jgi:hypothetical protein